MYLKLILLNISDKVSTNRPAKVVNIWDRDWCIPSLMSLRLSWLQVVLEDYAINDNSYEVVWTEINDDYLSIKVGKQFFHMRGCVGSSVYY